MMMANVTFLAQGFPVVGIKDERKQFSDFTLVMSFFGRISASFTKSIGVIKDFVAPLSPSGVTVQPASDKLNDPIRAIAFPVECPTASKILAHPFALASMRAKVILGSRSTGRRAHLRFAAPITNDRGSTEVFLSPCSHTTGSTTKLPSASSRANTNRFPAQVTISGLRLKDSNVVINAMAAVTRAVQFAPLWFKLYSATLAVFHLSLLLV